MPRSSTHEPKILRIFDSITKLSDTELTLVKKRVEFFQKERKQLQKVTFLRANLLEYFEKLKSDFDLCEADFLQLKKIFDSAHQYTEVIDAPDELMRDIFVFYLVGKYKSIRISFKNICFGSTLNGIQTMYVRIGNALCYNAKSKSTANETLFELEWGINRKFIELIRKVVICCLEDLATTTHLKDYGQVTMFDSVEKVDDFDE